MAQEGSKQPAKAAAKPEDKHVHKPGEAHEHHGEAKPAAAPKTAPAPKTDKPEAKKGPQPAAKAGGKEKKEGAAAKDEVKIVEEPKREHKARLKADLTDEQRARLQLRAAISGRRPAFRRQQWYEYKKLEDSGWRKPRGQDSAMRRHFGYEQNVVRVGYRGPADVRGLHPSGFEEVRVTTLEDLASIQPKKQAARVSANVGARKLKLIYAEADKRGVRILNRRTLA